MHVCVFFFFNDTATTEIYTLSLHDALPILRRAGLGAALLIATLGAGTPASANPAADRLFEQCARNLQRSFDEISIRCRQDRKSTRLNSSHANISYAVFCLKKKKPNR